MISHGRIQAVLAPAFNALLGIADGYFGRTPREQPGDGAQRAMVRLAEHRKRFWHLDLAAEDTRQLRRQAERRTQKLERTARKKRARKSPGGMAAVR